MPIFPSVNSAGEFESPAVQQAVKDLAKGEDDSLVQVDTSVGTKVTIGGVVVHYDSGWRDVSSFLTSDWQAASPPTISSMARMRRVNDRVSLDLALTYVGAPSSTSLVKIVFGSLPPGFMLATRGGAGVAFSSLGTMALTYNWPGFSVRTYTDAATWGEGATLRSNASYVAEATFPTTLPGTPA